MCDRRRLFSPRRKPHQDSNSTRCHDEEATTCNACRSTLYFVRCAVGCPEEPGLHGMCFRGRARQQQHSQNPSRKRPHAPDPIRDCTQGDGVAFTFGWAFSLDVHLPACSAQLAVWLQCSICDDDANAYESEAIDDLSAMAFDCVLRCGNARQPAGHRQR